MGLCGWRAGGQPVVKKQPYRPMTDIDIMEGAPAPSVSEAPPAAPEATPALPVLSAQPEDDAAPPPEARKQMNYRAKISTAERLRLISFRQRRPVQELIDEAVMLWLSNQK